MLGRGRRVWRHSAPIPHWDGLNAGCKRLLVWSPGLQRCFDRLVAEPAGVELDE
jgi:hypothetical protein